MRDSQRRLYGLELFQFANIEPVNPEQRLDEVPIRVTLAEGSHRRVNFGSGTLQTVTVANSLTPGSIFNASNIDVMTIGLALVAGLALPFWLQWLVFAALAIVSLVVFRQRIYAHLRPGAEGTIQDGVDGELAIAVASIPPGASGGVMLRGTRWTGRNQGNVVIPAGASCRVERRQGLILDVRLEKSGTSD